MFIKMSLPTARKPGTSGVQISFTLISEIRGPFYLLLLQSSCSLSLLFKLCTLFIPSTRMMHPHHPYPLLLWLLLLLPLLIFFQNHLFPASTIDSYRFAGESYCFLWPRLLFSSIESVFLQFFFCHQYYLFV